MQSKELEISRCYRLVLMLMIKCITQKSSAQSLLNSTNCKKLLGKSKKLQITIWGFFYAQNAFPDSTFDYGDASTLLVPPMLSREMSSILSSISAMALSLEAIELDSFTRSTKDSNAKIALSRSSFV